MSGTTMNPTRHFKTSMQCHRALKNLFAHLTATASQLLYLPSMKLTTEERVLKLKTKTQLMDSSLLLTLLSYTQLVRSSLRQLFQTITQSQLHLWTSQYLRNNNLNLRMLTNSAWCLYSTSWQMSSPITMKLNILSSTSSVLRDLEKWDKKLISSLYLISEFFS